MATMFPDNIDHLPDATSGEKETFRFVRMTAQPDNDYHCWFKPNTGDREPDFVLFSKHHGLLVLEVKDWIIDQIVAADEFHFTLLQPSGMREERPNPYKQAKGYVDALQGKLKQCREFIETKSMHAGNLRIPIGRMVVLPNIRPDEWTQRGMHGLIQVEKILFKGDLDPLGDLSRDTTGRKFADRIAPCFPFWFSGLQPKEAHKLYGAIWPVVRIDLPERSGTGKDRFASAILQLDDAQARAASNMHKGHQILKGPPGSGKTLVLANRCCLLHRYDPTVKRILLVCFNIALVSYLKRLIQEKGFGVGEGTIEVCHFYELAARILDQKIEYSGGRKKDYDTLVDWCLENVKARTHTVEPFDAILVDEGQDFNDAMLRALLGLLKPDGDFVIALDAYQDLYRRSSSWKDLGINAQGRTHYVPNVYRNTREIFEFTQRFIGETPGHSEHDALFPPENELHGERPALPQFPDQKALEAFLIEDIRNQIDHKTYKRSEIAIIYDDKVYDREGFGYSGRGFQEQIHKLLENAGIPTKWVSEDVRSKEMFDITTDRVTLISIHSAKGLDFDLVYLVGADRVRPPDEDPAHITRLLYVAMTRAKHCLVIPHVEETGITRRLRECLV